MFTGIIQAIGTIREVKATQGDKRMYIATGKLDLGDVQLGDSIAVNGVCLTAVDLPGDGFWADVSQETLQRSSLGLLSVGESVNLEKALTPTTRLGGHLVSGHVDGLGEVISIEPSARSIQFAVKAPDELARYLAEKGSVCTDGVSLTINKIKGAVFYLNIVPHTMQETNLQHWQVGTRMNLEVDVISRYLERLLLGDKAADENAEAPTLTSAFLAENGFLK